AVPYVMVRAFPPEVRFPGISFSYNVSYAIFGGLTPILVTVLMGVSPLAHAWYVLALSLMGLVLGVWLRQSEGRGSRHPGNKLGSMFFTKRYKGALPNAL
ncbi:MFS transporter, partial [Enterobacter hormaechei]